MRAKQRYHRASGVLMLVGVILIISLIDDRLHPHLLLIASAAAVAMLAGVYLLGPPPDPGSQGRPTSILSQEMLRKLRATEQFRQSAGPLFIQELHHGAGASALGQLPPAIAVEVNALRAAGLTEVEVQEIITDIYLESTVAVR